MRHLTACAVLLISVPALCALVIEPDAGGASTRAPAHVPGWANVGLRAGMTAVYLGNGWVITARHVGAGDVVLGGVTHHGRVESAVQLGAGGETPLPDLIVFRIEPRPALPPLSIRPTPPDVGDRVVMIGAGRERGARTVWHGKSGWLWGPNAGLRWGTNRVFAARIEVSAAGFVTRAFAMRFDPGETRLETQGAVGDSGGAAFIEREGRFELAGILIAVAGFPGQPPETALYGNLTTAADLSVYRHTLAALLGAP